MNKKLLKRNNLDLLLIGLLGAITFFTRFYFHSYSYDQYDVTMFKYSVDTLIPVHAPGYPVFLIFARFLNCFTHNSLSSLIYISVCSSVVFVITTFLIAKILFESRFVALSSALLVMANPTVWLYGIIGMSDMPQAAFVSLVVLFCAAAFKHKKPIFLYISLFTLGITLGVKINHVLLLPLVLYTGFKFRHDIDVILKSIISFITSIILWAIPFYTLMVTPQLKQATTGILLRDFAAFNVFSVGPTRKIYELIRYSAFSHFSDLSVVVLVVVALVLVFYIAIYLITKEEKVLRISLPYSFTNIKNIFTKYDKILFILLWALPYIMFIFVVIASRLRYYLPIYPAIAMSSVALLSSFFKLTTSNKGVRNNMLIRFLKLKKDILTTILISMLIIFSTTVSIYTVAPYHNELDTRSQVILSLKDIGIKNAQQGEETFVYINGLWGGRMDFYYYLIASDINNIPKMNVIGYKPLTFPFDDNELLKAEHNLLDMLSNDSNRAQTEVYLVGDLISSPNPLRNSNIVFRLKQLNDFSRQNEWIIDDPQGHIRVYHYENLGEAVWQDMIINNSEYNTPLSNINVGKLEDGSIYQYMFSHAPETGKKYINFTLDIPDEDNAAVDLNLLYGFVDGAEKTNGVEFSMLVNRKNIFSDNKGYTGNLSFFRFNLTNFKGESLNIVLGVNPHGNNAFDWSVWIPSIRYCKSDGSNHIILRVPYKSLHIQKPPPHSWAA